LLLPSSFRIYSIHLIIRQLAKKIKVDITTKYVYIYHTTIVLFICLGHT